MNKDTGTWKITTNKLTPEELAEKYSPTDLLNAFIIHEVHFRLDELLDVEQSKINKVKESIILDLQNNSDILFDYDEIDNFISKYLE